MNRAILLFIVLGLAAGGLGYLALGGAPNADAPTEDAPEGDSPLRTGAKGQNPAQTARETTDLAQINPVDAGTQAIAASGKLPRWEIIPMNAGGQRQPNAKIVASFGGDPMFEATGVGRFESVPFGECVVTIQQEGQPEWRRELTVDATTKSKLFAYIGDDLRISGEIIDTYGDPVVDEWIMFLPIGTAHPTANDAKKVKGASGTSQGALGGAVPVRSSKQSGAFRATLPKPGKYRVSVGYAGRQRWTQAEAIELTSGGHDFVRVVVPARSSLKLTFESGLENLPKQIAAYTFDAELAARIATSNAAREASDGGFTNVQEAQQRLKESAGVEGKGAKDADPKGRGAKGALPLRAQNRETFERNMDDFDRGGGGVSGSHQPRAPLFEPGWKSSATAYVDSDGTATLAGLPDSAGIRLLFVRGHERIATPGTLRVTNERKNNGLVTLPPPSAETNAVTQSTNASVRITLDKDAQANLAEPGVAWSFAKR